MKILYLTLGASGSGKSYYTENELKKKHSDLVVASADDYFMKSGTYQFNTSKLGQAHSESLWTSHVGMAKNLPVVVCNTNCKFNDFSKYLQQAGVFGYSVEFIIFDVPEDKIPALIKRNVHSVPEDAVVRQWTNLDNLRKILKRTMKTAFPELTYHITTIPFKQNFAEGKE